MGLGLICRGKGRVGGKRGKKQKKEKKQNKNKNTRIFEYHSRSFFNVGKRMIQ